MNNGLPDAHLWALLCAHESVDVRELRWLRESEDSSLLIHFFCFNHGFLLNPDGCRQCWCTMVLRLVVAGGGRNAFSPPQAPLGFWMRHGFWTPSHDGACNCLLPFASRRLRIIAAALALSGVGVLFSTCGFFEVELSRSAISENVKLRLGLATGLLCLRRIYSPRNQQPPPIENGLLAFCSC